MADKKVFVLAIIGMCFAAATLGCTGCTQQQTGEETELYTFQGLGVTQYGLPILGAGTPTGVEVVAAGSDAYISLILRNNAEGSQASNIRVSLQNIEPFQVRECGIIYEPTEQRNLGEYCAPYQEDGEEYKDTNKGYHYNTHFVSEMFPDEEVEFFWTLKSPESIEIGNMYYEQKIFYTIEFHYKVSMYQNLMAMTQSELTRRSSEGKAVTGTSDITNGELMVRSSTNEPVRYSTGSANAQSLVMEYRISNTNPAGIPVPESKVIISLTIPGSYVQIPDNIGDWDWTVISDSGCTIPSSACSIVGLPDDCSCSDWLKAEYDISDADYISDNIGARTIIKELDAYILRDVNDEFTIYAPLELGSGISPSVLSLPFYVRASYDYLLDGQGVGSTTLGVEPRGV